jgi:hypothetical protein
MPHHWKFQIQHLLHIASKTFSVDPVTLQC